MKVSQDTSCCSQVRMWMHVRNDRTREVLSATHIVLDTVDSYVIPSL